MNEAAPFSQLVVIGSSAGGVEALSRLIKTLPANLPAPIVVAQHLDPSRASHLGEILGRVGTLPVRTLSGADMLEPGVVYAIPPNQDVELSDHAIQLLPGSVRTRPSIDRLFVSAASIFGENLIAVILTGTGHDGAAGAADVQQAGGTVIVQDPNTAAFPELPRSLAPSAVDFVVPLDQIGTLIRDLLTGVNAPTAPDEDEALNLVLRLLHDRYSIDFRPYKRPTIVRRIQRRMVATGTDSISDYLHYVQQQPDEQHTLIASFLIKVTQFFRDPDLFAVLRDQILPDIVETARDRDHTIRLWSAGCATGEEAYSLAILLAEVLGDELEQFHVRIFATDLDEEAITFARQGLYPAGRLLGIDRAIVDRYFEMVDGGYQIAKRIRGLMVFGQHDLADRAPFPRVDLVLCRNVLIYFTPDLQRRILQLFAFSLRGGGYLILGKSETTTPFAEGYTVDDQRLKIYRRRGDQPVIPTTSIRDMAPISPPRLTPSRPTLYGRSLTPQPPVPAREQTYGLRTDAILFDLPVGVVVVDRRYDIQYINDAARSFLGIHGIAMGEDVIHLAQTVSAGELRAMIDRTLAGEAPVVATLVAEDGTADATRYLQVSCVHMPGDELPRVTICLADNTSAVQERLRLEEELSRVRRAEERIEQQRAHLIATNEELLAINQQLTREIADLRSQNEEYLVGNEELQAATEEVETLNEELQATNEELETLNEELQATVEELNTTNDDLQTRNAEIQDLAVRLEAARSRLYTVLNSLGEAIAVIDAEGHTILTNSQYDGTFTGVLDTIDSLDAEGHPRAQDDRPHRRAARGESFHSTFAVPSSDGTLMAYQVTGHPIEGAGEEVAGVLVIHNLDSAEPKS